LVGFNFPCHLGVANTTFTPSGITGLGNCAPLSTPWSFAPETVELVPFQCHFFLRVLLANEQLEVTSKYENRFLLARDRGQTFRYPTKTGFLIDTKLLDNLVDPVAQMSANNLRIKSGHF
jgi:hypothetical protein